MGLLLHHAHDGIGHTTGDGLPDDVRRKPCAVRLWAKPLRLFPQFMSIIHPGIFEGASSMLPNVPDSI